MTEDDPVRPSQALLAAAALDRLGVDELRTYVLQLRAEIGRAEAEIARKQDVLTAAEGFFRSP